MLHHAQHHSPASVRSAVPNRMPAAMKATTRRRTWWTARPSPRRSTMKRAMKPAGPAVMVARRTMKTAPAAMKVTVRPAKVPMVLVPSAAAPAPTTDHHADPAKSIGVAIAIPVAIGHAITGVAISGITETGIACVFR